MLRGVFQNITNPSRRKRRRPLPGNLLLPGLCALLILAALAAWLSTRTHVMSLGSEQQMLDSGLYADWTKGKVIVLIRHGERCDRSANPCLDDPTGITIEGSQAASDVGSGLQRLGLGNVEELASPEYRTRQTAHFIFGKDIASRDWLNECDRGFAKAAFEHKNPGVNLVLVTHSGCISDFEKQTGFPHAIAADYGSTLFVRIDAKGQLEVLGILNAEAWSQLNSD